MFQLEVLDSLPGDSVGALVLVEVRVVMVVVGGGVVVMTVVVVVGVVVV